MTELFLNQNEGVESSKPALQLMLKMCERPPSHSLDSECA